MTSPTSKFRAYDPESETVRERPPRILDIDGFNDLPDVVEIDADTFNRISILNEQEDYSEYPRRTWKTLLGFKSWSLAQRYHLDDYPDADELTKLIKRDDTCYETPLGYTFNIERVGIAQEGEDGYWREFFRTVSEYTEPFQFYASARVNRFPDVRDFDDGQEYVYVVTCVDGNLHVEKQTFERVETETILDDEGDGSGGDE